jgi:hypothetical protein
MSRSDSKSDRIMRILELIFAMFACVGTWFALPRIMQIVGLDSEPSVPPTLVSPSQGSNNNSILATNEATPNPINNSAILATNEPTPNPINNSAILATNEPTPNPIKNSGIDVYDDFNNSEYDGRYNEGVWLNYVSPPDEAVQENGVLALRLENTDSDEIVLVSKHYNNKKISYPISFEADLRLQSFDIPNVEDSKGVVAITIDTDDTVDWYTECGIVGTSYVPEPYVGCFANNYGTDYPNVYLDTWQTFRIEIDPATMGITYYLNNQQIGVHTPTSVDRIKNAALTFMIKAWRNTPGPGEVIGYVDNVKISNNSE